MVNARRDHLRFRLPLVCGGVVDVDGIEYPRPVGAADYVDLVINDRCRTPVTGIGHACFGCPCVGFRVVLFHCTQHTRHIPAADDVELSVYHRRTDSAANGWHTGFCLPFIRFGIISFVRPKIDNAVPAADRIDLAVIHDRSHTVTGGIHVLHVAPGKIYDAIAGSRQEAMRVRAKCRRIKCKAQGYEQKSFQGDTSVQASQASNPAKLLNGTASLHAFHKPCRLQYSRAETC